MMFERFLENLERSNTPPALSPLRSSLQTHIKFSIELDTVEFRRRRYRRAQIGQFRSLLSPIPSKPCRVRLQAGEK